MTASLQRWLLLLRIPLALLGVVLFFTLYNRFLLDSNLRNLRTSLSILDTATGVGQAEAALLLVDQTLVAQMAQEETDLRATATLQYSQGILAGAQAQRPVDDSQVMLNLLEESQTSERLGILRTLDGASSNLQSALKGMALLPRQVLGKTLSPEIDSLQMQEAARLEHLGRTVEAAQIYEKLLQDYPNYAGGTSLKLRLGYLWQRSGEFRRAENLYQEVLRDTRDPKETATAHHMIENLSQMKAKKGQAQILERKLSRMEAGIEQQQTAFDLGLLLIRLSSFDQAARIFHKSFEADPEGDLAPACLFKEGWCLRNAAQFEDALRRFLTLIQEHPKSDWAVASYLQIAEIYKAVGDLRAAAQAYEQASAIQQKDAALGAIVYAQIACTYEIDLEDAAKAQFYFHELAKRYPASPFSTVERRLRQLQATKGTLRATPGTVVTTPVTKGPAPVALGSDLVMGSPLLNWMESFLPVFVSVFTNRLTKYMEAVGETELARRFTEVEFKELVVREVQRRFPGQVTDVQTKIHPDSFIGSGVVHLGVLTFPISARIGIEVQENRPHAILKELKIGKLSLPEALLKSLEMRVNASIDRTKYPLKIREYTLKEGYAWISVEMAK